VASATTAVLTLATTAPLALPVYAPADGGHVAVVDVPDDDVLSPGWGQWENLLAPAPEPPVGVLVMREDDCVMSGRPTHGTEALSSCAALPISDGTAVCPEQEREHVNTPLVHFSEAKAEHALWQEFRDHGASLNRALNKALRIHRGRAWRIFQVRDLSPGFAVSPLSFLPRLRFP
jgi:hypothetical protein